MLQELSNASAPAHPAASWWSWFFGRKRFGFDFEGKYVVISRYEILQILLFLARPGLSVWNMVCMQVADVQGTLRSR